MSNTGAPDSHSIDFIAHFSTLSDPRQEVKLVYPLPDILLFTLCAVLMRCFVGGRCLGGRLSQIKAKKIGLNYPERIERYKEG